MKTLYIKRFFMRPNKPTLGTMEVDRDYCCYSFELPWKLNEKYISCIPLGEYHGYWDPEEEKYRIEPVEGRTGIQIHVGNSVKDTTGCICTGIHFEEDGEFIYFSTSAFDKLKMMLGTDPFKVVVRIHEIRKPEIGIRGNWRDVVRPERVSRASYQPEAITSQVPLKRLLGSISSLIGFLLNHLTGNAHLSYILVAIGLALVTIGIAHAVYKSKPNINGKAGVIYTVIDWLFTLIWRIKCKIL
jgi:hypothetical protein